jgi:hypothetical protein
MKFQLLERSITVFGDEIDASLIHPISLQSAKIVNPIWTVEDSPITTSVFSLIRYNSGITISADEDNFQIIDSLLDVQTPYSVTEIALKLISTLSKPSQSKFRGVSNKLVGFVAHPAPDDFLKTVLLSQGPWNDDKKNLVSMSYRMIYQTEWGLMFFQCDSGFIEPSQDSRESGILLTATFNYDARSTRKREAVTSIRQTLGNFNAQEKYFADLASEFFG